MNWEVSNMQSKTSFFNKTIYIKNLKRFWPLWGLATFLACLVPFAYILETIRADGMNMSRRDMFQVYAGCFGSGIEYLLAFYSIMVAMAVWNYLFAARSTNFFHSLPASRTAQFVSNYLAGLSMLIIPFVPSGIIMIVCNLVSGNFTLPGVTYMILGVLGELVLFFGFATIVAHITGNIVALPVLYFAFNYLEIIIELIVNAILSEFVYGYEFNMDSKFQALVPTVYVREVVEIDAMTETVKGFWVIGVYALAGILFAAGSYFVYKIRKSENAGDVVAFKPVKYVVQALFTVVASIGGGFFLYLLVDESGRTSRNGSGNIALLTICILLVGVVAYYLGTMLMEKDSRVFNKKTALGALICSAVYIIFCVSVGARLSAIENYVPNVEDIASVKVIGASGTFSAYEEDIRILEEVTNLHRSIIENKESLCPYGESEIYLRDDYFFTYIQFEYVLKNGDSAVRSYSVAVYDMGENSFEEARNVIVNDPEVTIRYLHIDDSYKLEYVYSDIAGGGEYYYNNIAETEETRNIIYEALIKDTKEGRWHPDGMRIREYDTNEGHIYLEFEFSSEVKITAVNAYKQYDYVSVNVNKDMNNTIEALVKTGVLTEEKVKTIFEE